MLSDMNTFESSFLLASRMEFGILLHNLHNEFQPLQNDESLYSRRRRAKDSFNDKSFTAYFPFYPVPPNFYKDHLFFAIKNSPIKVKGLYCLFIVL